VGDRQVADRRTTMCRTNSLDRRSIW